MRGENKEWKGAVENVQHSFGIVKPHDASCLILFCYCCCLDLHSLLRAWIRDGVAVVWIAFHSCIEVGISIQQEPLYRYKNRSKCLWRFKVYKSVHHRTIQINHQPDATIFQFIILAFIYSSTCFGRSPAHHQELNDCCSSLWFYLRIVVIAVLCSWSGRLYPARPRTQHGYHRL